MYKECRQFLHLIDNAEHFESNTRFQLVIMIFYKVPLGPYKRWKLEAVDKRMWDKQNETYQKFEEMLYKLMKLKFKRCIWRKHIR